MQKTIIALYDHSGDAHGALDELERAGFERSVIRITDQGTASRQGHSLLSRLLGWGAPEADAHAYAEGVRRGGILLSVELNSEDAEDIEDVVTALLCGKAVDIRERAASYRSAGWTRCDESAPDARLPDQDRGPWNSPNMNTAISSTTGITSGGTK